MNIIRKISNKLGKIKFKLPKKIKTAQETAILKKEIADVQKIGASLRIIIAAEEDNQRGWIPTNSNVLDLEKEEHWRGLFEENSINALLAEHVFDYLAVEQCLEAFKRCYRYLKKGGYLRVALPDGNLPDMGQINHEKRKKYKKFLFNYRELSDLLKKARFEVKLLEYWDDDGVFHRQAWNADDGFIKRSADHDERNKNGLLHTSVIVDAFK